MEQSDVSLTCLNIYENAMQTKNKPFIEYTGNEAEMGEFEYTFATMTVSNPNILEKVYEKITDIDFDDYVEPHDIVKDVENNRIIVNLKKPEDFEFIM